MERAFCRTRTYRLIEVKPALASDRVERPRLGSRSQESAFPFIITGRPEARTRSPSIRLSRHPPGPLQPGAEGRASARRNSEWGGHGASYRLKTIRHDDVDAEWRPLRPRPTPMRPSSICHKSASSPQNPVNPDPNVTLATNVTSIRPVREPCGMGFRRTTITGQSARRSGSPQPPADSCTSRRIGSKTWSRHKAAMLIAYTSTSRSTQPTLDDGGAADRIGRGR